MRALIAALSAAALVLVASCSSNDGADPRPRPTGSTREATPSSSPQKTAPVSAFAQVVAEYQPNLILLAADADTSCVTADDAAACQAAYGTFEGVAAQFMAEMLAVHSPSSSTYLGAPPGEVRTLVADTEELAGKASQMASAYQLATCPDPAACVQEKVFAQTAAAELLQKLGAWEPHM
jgi:hypothetical protein